ncbi:MAG: glycosyltransferase family 2 protein, partial [Chloroflexota bacterium]
MPEETVESVQTTFAPTPAPLAAATTVPFPGTAVPGPAIPTPIRKFSVVMPAYNEGKHIAANLRETVKALEGCLPEGAEFEVILVDDGSKDATLLEANSVADSEPRIKVKHLTRNGGKGLALQVGCIYVSGDL